MNKNSLKVPSIRFQDIERASCWLSASANLLTLGTAIGIVIGFALVWHYLNGFEIGYEIVNVLGSPQHLLVAAAVALAFSVWLVGLFLMIPSMLKILSDPSSHYRESTSCIPIWFFHLILCFSPFIFFSLLLWLDVPIFLQVTLFIALLTMQTAMFYFFHGGPPKKKWWDDNQGIGWIGYVLSLLLILTVLFALLCYGLLLIGKLAYQSTEAGGLGLSLVLVGYFLYCMVIVLSVHWRQGVISYLASGLVAISLLALFFANINNSAVALIRIGHYQGDFIVTEKVIDKLGEEHNFQLAAMLTEDIWKIENAWVIANLPDRIILSPTKDIEGKFSIPKAELRPTSYWFDGHN